MHHSLAAKGVHEIQACYVRRWPNDGMMIWSHLVQPSPGAARIHAGFGQTRHARSRVRQDFLDERWIKFSLEARRLFRIIPSQENSLPFAPEVKAGGHVDHHWKAFW